MNITELNTIAVPVTDQDKALAFYTEVLGFEIRMDGPFGDGRWLVVAPAGSAASVALMKADKAGVDTGIRFYTTDADADHAALKAAGADVDAEVLRMGYGVPPMFTVRDQDGNTLVLVEVAR